MIRIKVKLTSGQVIEEVVKATSVTIGRSQKSDVVIPDEALSRNHCQIDHEGESFFITDLVSSNGVSLDGKKIEPNKKTKFSTFQEILIGPLELTVSYEDDHFQQPSPIKVLSPSTKLNEDATSAATTKTTRSINRNALDKPFKTKDTKPKKKTSSGPMLIILPVVLILGGAIYYQTQNTQSQQPNAKSETANIPTGVNVSDEFLTTDDYISKDGQRSCDGANEATCKEMALKMDAAEGVVSDAEQVYIFIQPSTHLENPKFEKIKELQDRDDLIALYLTLKSPVFSSFQNKQTYQIHLVLRDEKYRIYRVYRFHTKYFITNGPEKARLLTELTSVFDGVGSASFWNEAKPIIHKKNL